MTELEAVNLLIQASGLARLTKQEHVQIEQAGQVLYKLVAPEKKKSAAKDNKQDGKAGG